METRGKMTTETVITPERVREMLDKLKTGEDKGLEFFNNADLIAQAYLEKCEELSSEQAMWGGLAEETRRFFNHNLELAHKNHHLREALTPFAEMAQYMTHVKGTAAIWTRSESGNEPKQITVAHIRNAAEALTPETVEKPE